MPVKIIYPFIFDGLGMGGFYFGAYSYSATVFLGSGQILNYALFKDLIGTGFYYASGALLVIGLLLGYLIY